MSAKIIQFPKDHGARKALIEVLKANSVESAEAKVDALLSLLWYRGFKIVPLDGEEEQ